MTFPFSPISLPHFTAGGIGTAALDDLVEWLNDLAAASSLGLLGESHGNTTGSPTLSGTTNYNSSTGQKVTITLATQRRVRVWVQARVSPNSSTLGAYLIAVGQNSGGTISSPTNVGTSANAVSSSGSIDRRCKRATKQSSPVTLSHSASCGMAAISFSTAFSLPGKGRMRTIACSV